MNVNEIITARKRSLRQGNVFTRVGHSVHRERVYIPVCTWVGGLNKGSEDKGCVDRGGCVERGSVDRGCG